MVDKDHDDGTRRGKDLKSGRKTQNQHKKGKVKWKNDVMITVVESNVTQRSLNTKWEECQREDK